MEHPGNCRVDPVRKAVDAEALDRAETAVLEVIGMGCQTCATRVRNSLLSRPGVVEAQVDLYASLALVHYDARRINPKDLLQAVAVAGGDSRHVYMASLLS